MERITIAKMDNQLGPKELYQYPPAEFSLPKEKFLKIWALHETEEEENSFIHFSEEGKTYLSLSKIYQNNQYFIVITIGKEISRNLNIYQEMLENISEELLTNLDNPQFIHILHESYDTIKNYTQINEEEMFIRLFQDKIRISILQILQSGTISKANLKDKLKKNFGYTNINLELFLAPFLRLKLIEIKDIHGITGVIFLKSDVFCCRLPPENQPENEILLKNIKEMFEEPQILSFPQVYELAQILKSSEVRNLIEILKKNRNGLQKKEVLQLLSNNYDLLEELEQKKLVFLEEEKLFLLSTVNFIKFNPQYIMKNVVERYENLKISAEQMVLQIRYLHK